MSRAAVTHEPPRRRRRDGTTATSRCGSGRALDTAAAAALGFGLAAALWWLYFARFDETVFDRRSREA
jgi:hypothetical protein